MFVRQLKLRNGKTYIQVVDKSSGRYRVVKSFGSAASGADINLLVQRAKLWIKERQGLVELDFDDEASTFQRVLNSISSHKLIGVELVLGKLFDEIGFNRVRDELFRDIVLYRLVYPKSKLKTTEYLYRYAGKTYSEDEIYRYMDKLYYRYKSEIQRISYSHTNPSWMERSALCFMM